MLDIVMRVLGEHPEIALFLALALGYLIGKIKVTGHNLGLVTGSLFAGLLIGQLGVDIDPQIKTIFLLLFLFANGYGAGPQFFRALKNDGIAPLLLTLVVTTTGLLCVWGMAKLMGLDRGFSAGLLSGALTQSPAIGTATEAIMALDLPLTERQTLVNHIPIADAVCYLFGFWGEVFYVAMILPRMLKINLEEEARKFEETYGLHDDSTKNAAMHSTQSMRIYTLENSRYIGKSAAFLEAAAASSGYRLFVMRLRRNGEIMQVAPETILNAGDRLAIAGRREWIVAFAPDLGAEIDDNELLDTPIDQIDVVITNSNYTGKPLLKMALSSTTSRGVFIKRLTRAGHEVPVSAYSFLDKGDVLTLIGPTDQINGVAKAVGFSERPTITTDMFTLGFGIAIGCLIGLPAFLIGEVKLSLSTSVGTLLAGLFFGWLRSVKPNLTGRVPEASQAFMVNFGLAGFVAITGLHAGPLFFSALKESGLALFFAGIICTCVPPTIGAYFGKYVLKMNPVLLLGAVSGAQTMTAAMVAVQEQAKSKAPVLGFTVPYALGNIILTTWGTVIVLLMSL